MRNVAKYVGQGLVLAAMAALIGYFSSHPVYHQMAPDKAQIKLSFAHGGNRVKKCRKLTAKEIAALPANERRPNTCSRKRVAVRLKVEIDGKVIYQASLPPTGLSGDGPSRVYRKFIVEAGAHTIDLHLGDTRNPGEYNYHTRRRLDLEPWQNLAIDFKADAGGFVIM